MGGMLYIVSWISTSCEAGVAPETMLYLHVCTIFQYMKLIQLLDTFDTYAFLCMPVVDLQFRRLIKYANLITLLQLFTF